MKKTILILIMLSITALSFSQGSVNFSVTKYGSYEVPYSSNNYYVITFPNQTQSQLYTSALMAVTRNFVSAKDVVSKVDNVMISVNAVHRFTERYSAFSAQVNYSVDKSCQGGLPEYQKIECAYVE